MNRSTPIALGFLALAACAADAQTTPAATPRPPFWATPRPLTPPATSLPPLSTATTATSLSGFGGNPAPQSGGGPPMRDVPLVEKKFEDLSNHNLSDDGKKALSINPEKWKHAETDNFILHYRRVTEAQKVAREVEYNLWYVATTLGATPDRYKRKSHVFIFEDGDEWKDFLDLSSIKTKWAASFAHGDDLYLNVRGGGNSGPGTSFDSHTLAHETTHAVIARLYPGERWPLWLNEGFAEYMGGASVAARKAQFAKRYERSLTMASMPLEKLATLTDYPDDPLQIPILYETSEKFVRFLITEHPKERFLKYIDAVVGGKTLQEAVLLVYGDKYKDWDAFEKRYEKFTK
jgi:hypothetical protein